VGRPDRLRGSPRGRLPLARAGALQSPGPLHVAGRLEDVFADSSRRLAQGAATLPPMTASLRRAARAALPLVPQAEELHPLHGVLGLEFLSELFSGEPRRGALWRLGELPRQRRGEGLID